MSDTELHPLDFESISMHFCLKSALKVEGEADSSAPPPRDSRVTWRWLGGANQLTGQGTPTLIQAGVAAIHALTPLPL